METKHLTTEKPVGDQSNKGRNQKFLECNQNENTTYQNLWDTAKAIVSRNFIAISAYVKKTETSQINNLMMQFKLLEKQEQTKSKTRRWREKIKIWAEINKIEIKQTIKGINETKSCFLEKTNKSVANMAKQNREKTQINKVREKKRT
jgi:hypothetical protein